MGTIKSMTLIFRYINQHPLGGKHKMFAYLNFLRWQVVSRLSKGRAMFHLFTKPVL